MTGLSVSVAAAPASVSAGKTSIITATVTGDDNSGAAVTLTTTYAVSIVASTGTTPVTAGQVSIITATVTSTSGSTSTPAVGVTVTFWVKTRGTAAVKSAAAVAVIPTR